MGVSLSQFLESSIATTRIRVMHLDQSVIGFLNLIPVSILLHLQHFVPWANGGSIGQQSIPAKGILRLPYLVTFDSPQAAKVCCH